MRKNYYPPRRSRREMKKAKGKKVVTGTILGAAVLYLGSLFAYYGVTTHSISGVKKEETATTTPAAKPSSTPTKQSKQTKKNRVKPVVGVSMNIDNEYAMLRETLESSFDDIFTIGLRTGSEWAAFKITYNDAALQTALAPFMHANANDSAPVHVYLKLNGAGSYMSYYNFSTSGDQQALIVDKNGDALNLYGSATAHVDTSLGIIDIELSANNFSHFASNNSYVVITQNGVNGMSFVSNNPTCFDDSRYKYSYEDLNSTVIYGPRALQYVAAGKPAVDIAMHVGGYTLNDGAVKDVYLNINDHFTWEQIAQNNISAVDLYGEDVAYTVESTNYNPNQLGDYQVILKAVDTYDNEATATINLHVSDYDKPTVTKKHDLRIAYTDSITLTDVLACFDISDNVAIQGYNVYDGQELVLSTMDGNNTITVNDYLPNDQVGNYSSFFIEVYDSSNNMQTCNFTISTFDNVKPVNTSDYESDNHIISASNANDAFINRIISQYRAHDVIDGDIAITYSGNISAVEGSYSFTLTAKDAANNTATQVITFTVKNDTTPWFEVSDNVYLTTVDNPLTLGQLQSIILDKEDASINDVEDLVIDAEQYLNNASKAGVYTVNYTIKMKNNETPTTGSLDIQVVGKKQSGWDKFVNEIKNFFIKLGHWLSFKGWTL